MPSSIMEVFPVAVDIGIFALFLITPLEHLYT